METTMTPLQSGYLPVSSAHKIFYETFGNPEGVPMLFLHGGPGAGCQGEQERLFDLEKYYVVLIDQRGAPRSITPETMDGVTPQDMIEDLEKLRDHLGIEKWVIFGGSWGSLLSILYGEAHPERCLGFILRGIFLGRKKDYRHLVDTMGATFPEPYAQFCDYFSGEGDIIDRCYAKVMSSDTQLQLEASIASQKYFANGLLPNPSKEFFDGLLFNEKLIVCLARAYFHMAKHDFFIQENQALNDLPRISHLPAIIIHGELDYVCPYAQAQLLHQGWKNSTLHLIKGAGHAPADPKILEALLNANSEMLKCV